MTQFTINKDNPTNWEKYSQYIPQKKGLTILIHMGFLKIKALKGIKIQVNNGEKTGMNNSPKIENASHTYEKKFAFTHN